MDDAQPGPYSGVTPASLTTFAHFADCSRRCAANCSGVLPITSTPRAVNFSTTSGVFRVLTNSALSLAMIGAGPAARSAPMTPMKWRAYRQAVRD